MGWRSISSSAEAAVPDQHVRVFQCCRGLPCLLGGKSPRSPWDRLESPRKVPRKSHGMSVRSRVHESAISLPIRLTADRRQDVSNRSLETDRPALPRDLASLVAGGKIDELSRGVYRRADAPETAHSDLAVCAGSSRCRGW